MNNNDEFLYLIANPYRKKKTFIIENVDEELLLLMNKKYKNYIFDEDIFKKILLENKKLVEDYTIQKIVEKTINNCVDEILLKQS